MAPGSSPQAIRRESAPPAVPARSEWLAAPGTLRLAVRAATPLRGAIRDRPRPAAPRVLRRFVRKPTGTAPRLAGNARRSYAAGCSIPLAQFPEQPGLGEIPVAPDGARRYFQGRDYFLLGQSAEIAQLDDLRLSRSNR